METYRHMHEVIPIPALFEPDDFLLDPPPSNDDECVALGAKASLKTRTVAQSAEVASQAHSTMHALQPVFDILGIDLSHPPAPAAAAAAVNLVQQNITRVVFYFKNTINRNRPWNTCKGRVDALWKKGDRLYPGHSSYPSGHATTAYTWAYYLGTHFPAQKQKLLDAARQVAENREIAGVHFRSDSDAGEKLGKAMAERLREAEANDLIDLSVITKLSPVPRP